MRVFIFTKRILLSLVLGVSVVACMTEPENCLVAIERIGQDQLFISNELNHESPAQYCADAPLASYDDMSILEELTISCTRICQDEYLEYLSAIREARLHEQSYCRERASANSMPEFDQLLSAIYAFLEESHGLLKSAEADFVKCLINQPDFQFAEGLLPEVLDDS